MDDVLGGLFPQPERIVGDRFMCKCAVALVLRILGLVLEPEEKVVKRYVRLCDPLPRRAWRTGRRVVD